MKKNIILVMLALLCVNSYNQEFIDETDDPKYCFSMVPQYLFINGIRLDFDIRIKNTSQWIILAPQYYSSHNDYIRSFSFESLRGFGLFTYYRNYFKNHSNPSGFYFQSGLTYNFTHFKNTEEVWTNTLYDGTEALNKQEQTFSKNIHKVGGDILLGLQTGLFGNMFIDVYGGFGVRESIYKKDALNPIDGSTSSTHPAFSGVTPIFGIRFGGCF